MEKDAFRALSQERLFGIALGFSNRPEAEQDDFPLSAVAVLFLLRHACTVDRRLAIGWLLTDDKR